MQPYIKSYSYISDRVAILDLEIPTKTSSMQYRIVNAYGPTMFRAKENPNLIIQFYEHLTSAINVPNRHEIYILGDFNSKLGSSTAVDHSNNTVNECIGKYGMGPNLKG